MPGFYIADFAGMVPRQSPRLLQNNQAQNALNAKLWSGELEAYRDLSSIVTPSKSGTKRTIYRFGQDVTNEAQYWFHWTDDIDVARGPINSDTSERTYWTGETEPRVTDNSIALTGGTDYPMNYYKLGVPKPASAPSLSSNGAGTGDPKSTAVVITYVTGWGEEGPPSDPSSIVTAKYGDTLTISSMAVGPGAGYNVTTKRIYLAITGSGGTDYQYVTEVAAAVTSTTVSFSATTLGEVIPSKLWIPPPTSMIGLLSMGNGMMAGFESNNVWLCEPNLPHAWPARYRKSLPYGVVGLGTFDSNLVALTKGAVYMGAAVSPAGLTLPKITDGKACVSKRGIVNLPGAVAYPCADGLGLVTSAGWTLATEGLFTPEQWDALVPSSIAAYRWGRRYVGFYDTGTVQRGFIFDPLDPRSSWIYIDLYATAGYNDPKRDALYLQVGSSIKKWNATSALSYTWKSKVFTMQKPVTPRFGQVIATSYPVTFKLYADGSLKHTQSVTSANPFSLTAMDRARDFEVQLEGTATVRGVAVATSMNELQNIVT